tara:strand:- start:633 stop:1109 length:477 start_codon:yes stop_codon:yes gene_type:complete
MIEYVRIRHELRFDWLKTQPQAPAPLSTTRAIAPQLAKLGGTLAQRAGYPGNFDAYRMRQSAEDDNLALYIKRGDVVAYNTSAKWAEIFRLVESAAQVVFARLDDRQRFAFDPAQFDAREHALFEGEAPIVADRVADMVLSWLTQDLNNARARHEQTY